MRTHTYLQYMSEMRTHTCVLRKKCSSTFLINRRRSITPPLLFSLASDGNVFQFPARSAENGGNGFQFPSLYRPETFFSFLRGRQRTEETVFSFQKMSQKKIPLNLDECEMHVKVPLNAFIVVFVQALDKQTPLSS